MSFNHCFTCNHGFYSLANLNRHFQTIKHDKNYQVILDNQFKDSNE